jgi:hypothetical protein
VNETDDSIFNVLVAPVPVVQLLNLLAGIFILGLEWPLPFLKGTALQRAFAIRFALYPIVSVIALIQYQCTNAAFYLLIGTAYGSLEVSLIPGSTFKLGVRGS